MELKDLKIKLQEVKDMSWVKSKRKGNTGIGYTLETLLNIDENNIKTPDFGNIELKSQRKNAGNKVTMFTFNRAVWKISQRELIEKYGYVDTEGRKALYCTVDTKPNAEGLYLRIEDRVLILYHVDGTIIAEWKIEDLVFAFEEKMPALVVVLAESHINSEEREEFWFNEAYFLKEPEINNFIDLMKKDIIIVDIRMHLKKNNAVRNHDTAFRIDERFLYLCFSEKERLI